MADLIVAAMRGHGLSEAEARGRCWFVDSKGLVVKSPADLAKHKLPYAHEDAPVARLAEAIAALQPTALMGSRPNPAGSTRRTSARWRGSTGGR